MLTLQIIGGILGVVLIGYLIFLLIRKIFRIYWSKFEFNIFSKKIFITEAIIVLLTIAGVIVMDAVTRNKGDEWNGYVLFIIAILILLGLFIYIYKKNRYKIWNIGSFNY